MAPEECISALGGWEGYELCGWRQERRGESRWCVLRLRRDRSRPAYCSGCWREAPALHDTEWRTVRDLPMFEHALGECYLEFPQQLEQRSAPPGLELTRFGGHLRVPTGGSEYGQVQVKMG